MMLSSLPKIHIDQHKNIYAVMEDGVLYMKFRVKPLFNEHPCYPIWWLLLKGGR